MKNRMTTFVAFLFIIILAGCSSMEDIISDTENKVNSEFTSNPIGVNTETNEFTYYLPEKMKIEHELNHNIILKEGKQTYILFINTIEKPNSRVLYDTSLSTDQDYLVNKTFEDDERFGYVQVLPIEKNLYEISVGIGGVKLTTETKTRNIITDAEKMMRIANSVRQKP